VKKKLMNIWENLESYNDRVEIAKLITGYDAWAESMADEIAGELAAKSLVKDILILVKKDFFMFSGERTFTAGKTYAFMSNRGFWNTIDDQGDYHTMNFNDMVELNPLLKSKCFECKYLNDNARTTYKCYTKLCPAQDMKKRLDELRGSK